MNLTKRSTKEISDLPAVFRAAEISAILDVNLTRAYEIARQPGVSIRAGKRLIVLRDGLKKWMEDEAQKDKNI